MKSASSQFLFAACALILAGVPDVRAADATATDRTATFSLPGGSFKAPVPEGYCVPTGEYDANAKITAAADTANLTDISFTGCAEMQAGLDQVTWAMIKTPLESLKESAGARHDVIDYFKNQIKPEDLKKWTDEAQTSTNAQAQTIYGKDLKIATEVKPLAADAFGAYLGGTISVDVAADKKILLTCVYGITVVNDRIFTLYFYSPYRDARDVVALLAKVQTATQAFVNANGG